MDKVQWFGQGECSLTPEQFEMIYADDEGEDDRFTVETIRISKKQLMKLDWLIMKDSFKMGFKILWEIVVLSFRKVGDG